MKQINRPDQINLFLKTIGTSDDIEIGRELETYIAELEAKQPDRPTRIATILRQIDTQYPEEIGTSLEIYISELEARQQTVPSGNGYIPARDTNNPPVWSHARAVRREQQIRQRALRKQNKSW